MTAARVQRGLRFKTGDPITLSCLYKIGGVAQDLSAVEIRSQMRTEAGALICNFAVAKSTTVGRFSLNATAEQSAAFPPGSHFIDILYVGQSHTETFNITITKSITVLP